MTHWLRSTLPVLVLSVAPRGIVLAQVAPADTSASVAAVWALEDAYWRYVQAGDVASYRTLWHDRFVGWPCVTPHTATKDSIGGWVRRIRDEHIQLTFDLKREGVADLGSTIVVYYSTPMIRTYPDGRIEGRDTTWKFTHTWQRDRGRWQIIGGMCGLPATGVF
jgi:hypothetical protein